MSSFEEYIQSLGYKPFKKTLNKKKEWEYIPITENKCSSFSSMEHGRIDNRWIKGDIEIIWGLNEKGKPPTLVYPRPKIKVIKEDGLIINQQEDDAMNIALKKYSPKEVYEACFDTTIVL